MISRALIVVPWLLAGSFATNRPTQAPPVTHPIFLPAAGRISWSRMVAANHPWAVLARGNCTRQGTSTERNGENGFDCAVVYAFDHDPAAFNKALAKVLAPPDPPDMSSARQECGSRVIMADYLDAGMTPAQRASAFTLLNDWVRYAVHGDGKPDKGGIRLYDSDHSTSQYLCAALLDAYTRGSPHPTHWLDSTMNAPGVDVPFVMGGLGSTAKGTLRAMVESRAAMCAAGGEWGESSQYNPNTMLIIATGYAALRNAYGVDSLPTIGTCLRLGASRIAWDVTPDLKQMIQWGDDEDARDFKGKALWRISTLAAALSGIENDPVARGLVAQLAGRYGWVGYATAEPIIWGGWVMPWYDPAAPIDTTPRLGIRVAPGRGHLWVRSGASLFWAAAENATREDHQPEFTFGYQLYRNGEWAIPSPIGYTGPFRTGAAQNGAVYAGFGAMYRRGFERYDTTGGVACVTGSTGGGLYQPGRTDLGWPPFLSIGRRTTCYVQINGTDVVVTKDSVVIAPPQNAFKHAGFGGYYPSDSAALDPKGGWFAVWHPQTVPTRTGNTWTWTTPGNQRVQLTAFGAGLSADSLLTESQLWKGQDYVKNNPTLAYQLRLRTSGQVLIAVQMVGSALPVTEVPNGVRVGTTTILLPGGK